VRSQFIFTELHLRTECQLYRLCGITEEYRPIIKLSISIWKEVYRAKLLIKMTSFEVGNLTYGMGAVCLNIQLKRFNR
jgi:hypothetical protein